MRGSIFRKPRERLGQPGNVTSLEAALARGTRPVAGTGLLYLSAFIVVLSASASALAEPAADELVQARRLFNEAELLERNEDWSAAIDKLRRALAIKETPGLRYHLAYCQEQMGHLVEALANYDRAAELLDSGAVAKDVAALLGPARAALAPRVPTLDLGVSGSVSGAKFKVDERELLAEQLAHPILLNPGTYRIVVSAPGRRPLELTVTLTEGDRKVVRAELKPPRQDPSPPPSTPSSDSTRDSGSLSPRTVVLASEALLTLVALGVGVGYTVERSLAAERAEEARSDLDRRTDSEANVCRNPTAEFASSCARLEEANQDGIDASHLATLGFVGAGIAAAATVATWYLWRPEEPRHALGIHAAPVAGRGMLGGLSGSF